MRRRILIAVISVSMVLMLITSSGMVTSTVHASEETWSESELNVRLSELNSIIGTTNRPQLEQFLGDTRDQASAVLGGSDISEAVGLKTKKALVYAQRLANDLSEGSAAELWVDSPFVVYNVPALSPEMRLPNALPKDGAVSNQIRVVSAQDEFEAASFLFAPLSDVDEVTFSINELQGADAVIPAGSIDLRVVKTWYQGGTAWQSYFFDDSKDVLTPELLLYDESLIQVDHEEKKNYLRIDYPEGSQYVNMSGSPPAAFNRWNEPVADSPVLLPIELKQGESKQMWITTKVPSGTPEGIYSGTIDIEADGAPAGQITLKIRVLPFELPDPKTYYNIEKDFYTLMYHGADLKNGLASSQGQTEMVEESLLNQYQNMADHNVLNAPGPHYKPADQATFIRQLELMLEAGLDLDPLFAVAPTFDFLVYDEAYKVYKQEKAKYETNPTEETRLKMEAAYAKWRTGAENFKIKLQEIYDDVTEIVGHTNLYFDGWDEAFWEMLLFQQENWEFIQNTLGAKIYATGHENHMDLPITEDFLNWFGEPTREKADAWHALGEDKLITNYAHPHSGPENPDLMRQRHGLWLYKANYDAVYNYIWFYESQYVNPWGDYVDATYREFNFVYLTQTGVIDTLAWEGFREGIDDIRYATKLKQVAQDAISSGQPDRVAAANKALTWLEEMDERSTSSDLIRYEMIYQIMTLLDLAETE